MVQEKKKSHGGMNKTLWKQKFVIIALCLRFYFLGWWHLYKNWSKKDTYKIILLLCYLLTYTKNFSGMSKAYEYSSIHLLRFNYNNSINYVKIFVLKLQNHLTHQYILYQEHLLVALQIPVEVNKCFLWKKLLKNWEGSSQLRKALPS